MAWVMFTGLVFVRLSYIELKPVNGNLPDPFPFQKPIRISFFKKPYFQPQQNIIWPQVFLPF